tara:strand:- start:3049 stop:3381 length:333 start_codon:yes stop_codon:yes gene_type:complete
MQPFNRGYSPCPVCGEKTWAVKESRSSCKTKDYLRRRRKYCSSCNHASTTYEITGEQYEDYLKNKKIIDKLRGVLEKKKACFECVHYYQSTCNLEIPELDAEECSYYSIK